MSTWRRKSRSSAGTTRPHPSRLPAIGSSRRNPSPRARRDGAGGIPEQAIRFVMIDRRITQGTRSETGRQWCELIRTAPATRRAQQGRSVLDDLERGETSQEDQERPVFGSPSDDAASTELATTQIRPCLQDGGAVVLGGPPFRPRESSGGEPQHSRYLDLLSRSL